MKLCVNDLSSALKTNWNIEGSFSFDSEIPKIIVPFSFSFSLLRNISSTKAKLQMSNTHAMNGTVQKKTHLGKGNFPPKLAGVVESFQQLFNYWLSPPHCNNSCENVEQVDDAKADCEDLLRAF